MNIDYQSPPTPQDLQRMRALLDAHANDIDTLTRAKLRAARCRALMQHRPQRLPSWLVPATAFAGAAAVLLSLIWNSGTMPDYGAPALADAEVISAAADGLDLYEDLDFYEWLDADAAAHPG